MMIIMVKGHIAWYHAQSVFETVFFFAVVEHACTFVSFMLLKTQANTTLAS